MSPEKQAKEPDAQKKKIMMVVVVIIGIFLAWQIKGMFFGGGEAPPELPPPPAQMASKAPNATPGAGSGAAPGALSAPAQPEQLTPKQAMLQTNAELFKLQQENQKKYVTSLNELEMLKLKIELAKANEALTETKLSTIATEKKVAELLAVAPPPLPPPTLPAGAFATNLVAPFAAGQSVPNAPPPLQPADGGPPVVSSTSTSSSSSISYIVLSVSFKDNKWSTVIGYQDKLYSVSVGDTLPADGSKVLSINKEGVVLGTKDGKKKKITLSTTI